MKTRKFLGTLLLALIVGASEPAAAATTSIMSATTTSFASYTVTDLGSLGGCCPAAYAINSAGQVVGAAFTAAGPLHAFSWQNGSMTDLGTLGGQGSYAFGVNDSGQVAGGSDLAQVFYNTERAFLWQSGTMTNLDDPNPDVGTLSEAAGINASGVVVGDGERNDGYTSPLVFSGGSVTRLPTPCCLTDTPFPSHGFATAINGVGQIVGWGDGVTANGGPAPLRWENGAYTELGSLGGDGQGEALAINNAGQVVGWSHAGDASPHAFVWQSGTMSDLGLLPGETGAVAYAINTNGVVVGNINSAACGCGPDSAFIYQDGVMRDLNNLIPADSGWRLQSARGINDSGQIVGIGFVGLSQRAFLLTPVQTDTTAPTVSCGTADAAWHATNVSIACTASDSGSGLANAGDASFSLSTSVPAGTEDANASTDSRLVCDNAGNCTTAGPISGNKIDRKAPSIAIGVPTNGAAYLLRQSVTATYSCSDGGSGLASCAGTVASGTNIDTGSVGTKTFSVTATDAVGNSATQTLSYTVSYAVHLLYDPAKPTNTIQLQLQDATGANVSSASIVLTATSIDGTISQSGTFTYLKSMKAYKYGLPKGLSSGAHTLYFTADGDPVTHTAPFRTR